jgi:hypothetical protein
VSRSTPLMQVGAALVSFFIVLLIFNPPFNRVKRLPLPAPGTYDRASGV